MKNQLKICPVCGKESSGTWIYTCSPCWLKLLAWVDDKYGDRHKKPIHYYLPKYIAFINRHNREKVCFT